MVTVLIGSGRRLGSWLGTLLFFALSSGASAQLHVVTTIPDFADLAERIGGEAVEAVSLTQGHEDMHSVRIRPSLVIKLRRADAFIQLGLSAEHAWVPALLRTARNAKVQPGQPGFCNASIGIVPLGVPESSSRAEGPDPHLAGNPHYNLGPLRMRTAARNIRDCLIRLDPTKSAQFRAGCAEWERELDRRLKRWKAKLDPLRGSAFIEANNAWIYFADAFDLRIVAQLEPKPGMAPTPGHLTTVIELGRRARVGLVVVRARYADAAKRVAGEIGATAAPLLITSSTKGKTAGWFEFMDHVVETFATTLTPPAIAPGADEGKGK